MYIIEEFEDKHKANFGDVKTLGTPLLYIGCYYLDDLYASCFVEYFEGKFIMHGIFHVWNKTIMKQAIEDFPCITTGIKEVLGNNLLYIYFLLEMQPFKKADRFSKLLGFGEGFIEDNCLIKVKEI